MSDTSSTPQPPTTPEARKLEFRKIMTDFIRDITTTFPEYTPIISRWWNPDNPKSVEILHNHCLRVYPERFFDIIWKNEDIFLPESDTNTEFLMGVVFKNLWNIEGISEATRATIWTYLQLVLFVLDINNTELFGETAQLFEAINEGDLRDKLQETFANIEQNFNTTTANDLPTPDDLNARLANMMKGKIGKFAQEIAEETAHDLGINPETVQNPKDIIKSLIKRPKTWMGTMKKIKNKFDEKIASGEITQSEMYQESLDILEQMESIPGMGGMKNLMETMGGAMGGKVNMGATKTQLNRNLKMAKMKEQMQARLAAKLAAASTESTTSMKQTPANAVRPETTSSKKKGKK